MKKSIQLLMLIIVSTASHAANNLVPFDGSAEIPRGYTGADIVAAVNLLESKKNKLQKDQYESSAEYAERMSKADQAIAPLSTEKSYAFKYNNVRARYDADKRTIIASFTLSPESVIDIQLADKINGRYQASNAFGAKAMVTKRTTTIYQLAPDFKAFASLLGKDAKISKYATGSTNCYAHIKAEPSEARQIVPNIGMLFVTKLRQPFLYSKEDHYAPELGDLNERTNIYKELKVDIESIYFYDNQTGRVAGIIAENSPMVVTCYR